MSGLDPFLQRMMDTFTEYQLKRAAASWCFQNKEERKHRLHTLTALVVELERIRSIDIFATAFGDMAIEDVIQGDWASVAETISWFTFPGDDQQIQDKYTPLWEGFRAILLAAVAEEKRIASGAPRRPH